MRISFTIVLFLSALVSQAQRAYPFQQNGKWGMITASGKVVMPPAYRFEHGVQQEYGSTYYFTPANIRPDINGLYRFYDTYNDSQITYLTLYRCALVDTMGHTVAVLDSLNANIAEHNFHGLYMVYLGNAGRTGVYDIRLQKYLYISPNGHSSIRWIKDSLYMRGTYRGDSGWRLQLSDSKGKLLSKKVYMSMAEPFTVHLSYGEKPDYYCMVVSERPGKWFQSSYRQSNEPVRNVDIMDSTGKILTLNHIRYLRRLSHDLLEVEDTLGKHRVINFKGETLLTDYIHLSPVQHSGLFKFNHGGYDSCVYHQGYRSGCIIYEGGLVCHLIGGLWGLMDAKGKVVVEPVFRSEPHGSEMGHGWTSLYENLTEGNYSDTSRANQVWISPSGKVAFINLNRPVWSQYSEVVPGYKIVGRAGKEFRLFRQDGTLISTAEDFSHPYYGEEYLPAYFSWKSEGRWGVIDTNGNWVIPPAHQVPVWQFADGFQTFLYPDKVVLYNASGKRVDQVAPQGRLIYLGGGYILKADSGYTHTLTDTAGRIYSKEIEYLHKFYRVLQVEGRPVGVRHLPRELTPHYPDDNPYFTDLDKNYRYKDWGKTWYNYKSHHDNIVRVENEDNGREGYIALPGSWFIPPMFNSITEVTTATDTLMIVRSELLYYAVHNADKDDWTNYTVGLLNSKGQWIYGSAPGKQITRIDPVGDLLVMQTASPDDKERSWGYVDMKGNIVWWSDNKPPVKGTVSWEKLKKWNPRLEW